MDYYDTEMAIRIEKLKQAYHMETAPIIQTLIRLYEITPMSTTVTWDAKKCKFNMIFNESEEITKLKKVLENMWQQTYEPRMREIIDSYIPRKGR